MPKKTFQAAPKPKQLTPDEIEAFEQGGAGHDGKTAKSTHVRTLNAASEPTKRLSLDLPESTHTRFKTACSATRRKMVAEIQQFIENRTTELEAEAGLPHK